MRKIKSGKDAHFRAAGVHSSNEPTMKTMLTSFHLTKEMDTALLRNHRPRVVFGMALDTLTL